MSKKQICCLIDEKDVEQFQQCYPYMLSQFIRKAIKKALENKTIFVQIAFGD